MDGPEAIAGQAAGLRNFGNQAPVRVIAVTGAKGGVGKTNVSVNLAVAMARAGRRVMLLDADLGLANVDVLLGLQSRKNLSHVMDGECSLDEIMVEGPAGVQILPAASGVKRMVSLSTVEHAGLINAFSALPTVPEVLIVDTAAGISDSVIRFSVAAQDILVVVCDEPASITDAYALIKVLNRDHGQDRFHVLANMVPSAQDGRQLFQKLLRVTERFLNVTLDFVGSVPYDENLRKAVQRQMAVVEAFPRSRSSMAFDQVARTTERWPRPDRSQGHLEFFVERLVQSEGF